MPRVTPMSVVESLEFSRKAADLLLSDEQILALVSQIAKDPKAGVVIQGTGGVRKLRFSTHGKGKRGGGRAVYVYYCEEVPVFLLTCFAKNAKADLDAAEKKVLRELVSTLRTAYEAGVEIRIDQARRVKEKGDNETDQGEQTSA